MDLITDLPLAEGYDSILVMVDQGLSKGVILVLCRKSITSEDTAQLLLETFINDLDFQIKLSLIEDPSSHQKYFWNY